VSPCLKKKQSINGAREMVRVDCRQNVLECVDFVNVTADSLHSARTELLKKKEE